ncbi:MAG: efflux transporter outer membrane subunit [Gammaproteobacteria bacterium]|nr:efflux transporter outer membrane subunit [Gammaproteobacteria bacterium]
MDNDQQFPRCWAGLRLLSSLLLIVPLGGCAKLGPDFTKPPAPVAKDWLESDPRLKRDAAELRTWWKLFEDPVLDRLIDAAQAQNLPLQIAGLRILEARAGLGIALGQRYPQVQQVGGGAIFERSSDNQVNTAGTDSSAWTYDVGFDAAWELDLWGRFQRGIESADASLLASVADYQDVLVSLTAEVANAYLTVRTFEERIALANENVAIQRRGVALAAARYRNGETTELDLQQARALLNDTRATIPLLAAGLRHAQNALATLLGEPPGQVQGMLVGQPAIPRAPTEVAVGLPAELLRRRPDVRRAELRAAAQSALVGVATTDLYPRFTLIGSIGLAASSGTNTTRSGDNGFDKLFDADSLTFVGGPSFTWNLFNYGRIKNSVRVQDARLQQLLVNYQETVLRAAREVEDAMVGYVRSQEQVRFLAASVTAARRAVDISLLQYRDGAVDYQRVLDSQNSLVTQQDLWTKTRGDVTRNLVAMYKSLGGGWQIHEGRPVVPQQIRDEMRRRTDWGGLLEPSAPDGPAS